MIDLFATRFLFACLGVLFVLTGMAGLSHPQLFKTYLIETRCLSLIALGMVTITFHYRYLDWLTRIFASLCALGFGSAAWLGFQYGILATRKTGPPEIDQQLLVLLDGRLELGRNDHRLHLAVAAVFLLAAVAPATWEPAQKL